jgi:hypothetical protein
MSSEAIHQCQCPDCQQPGEQPNKKLHYQMNLLLARLDEQQRRWYVALEVQKLGRGGAARLAQITGMHVDTIRRGQEELDNELANRPAGRVRLPGGGRPPVGKKRQASKKR